MRQEEKNLGDGAIDVGGGGEIAAERFEFGNSGRAAAEFDFLMTRARLLCGAKLDVVLR